MRSKKTADFNLLEESFPGITANVLRCESLGFPWTSKPFLKKYHGQARAHVGILDYPVFIEGQLHNIGALHALCTKAEYRGQGLASELIQEALEWSNSHYESVILFTEIPAFYEKLSFRRIQEYRFHLAGHHSKGSQTLTSMTSPQDDKLFRRRFHERAATSHNFWAKDNGTITAFNALFSTFPTYWSLYYSPSIDGIVSCLLEDKTLHLFDVIANKMPPLDLILNHLPTAIEEIYFYFPPDQFTESATPEPHLYGHDHLMAHGALPDIKPFMISPLSRC
jgi:GNAT superfamily N-acetyltransferase